MTPGFIIIPSAALASCKHFQTEVERGSYLKDVKRFLLTLRLAHHHADTQGMTAQGS